MIIRKNMSWASFRKKMDAEDGEESQDLNWLMTGIDLESRIIEIRAEISEAFASIIIRALMHMSSVSKEPIQIILSSPGGDAYEALAVYDAIQDCPCEVSIKASGKIMSAAFIIYLAGKYRTATKHSTFMMHSAHYGGVDGNVKLQEVELNETKRLNSDFLNIAEKRTKRNKKWWARTVLIHDRYFTVSEALEIGIMTPPKASLPTKKKVIKRKIK